MLNSSGVAREISLVPMKTTLSAPTRQQLYCSKNAFLHIIQYIFKDIIDIIYLTVTPLTLVEGSTCLSSLLAPKRVEIEDMFESGDKEATSMRVLKAAKITSSSVGHDTSCEEN